MLAVVINFAVQAQQQNGVQYAVSTKGATQGPGSIVRTITQDKKGNIWIASWEGVFKYDGKSFTNITRQVSSARFFSVLEDSKGNFWFTSVGSGVYYYDGKSFRNFTTKDGLANDRVTFVYEDKQGTIWFGTEGGASRYDGKTFQNFKMREAPLAPEADSVYVGPKPVHFATDSVYVGSKPIHIATDSVHISSYQHTIAKDNWIHNDVNAIIEDKTGKLWFGTRGFATVYDGKSFTVITNKDGKPFTNVRSIIKDKKGNMWLGGADGLWRYDGKTFTNFIRNFVGYIYEDKKGNIWTSSEKGNNQGWALSRYDEKSLYGVNPKAIEITTSPMIFGILEANDWSIWFGDFDGVHRYDGKTITDFKSKEGGK